MIAPETSLGLPLTQTDTGWEIDLSRLHVFSGLSVLSRIIGERILDHVENNPGDVSFLQKVNPNINPELIALEIHYVQVYARSGVLAESLWFKEAFQAHLIDIFGTLQRSNWREQLHPSETTEEAGSTPATVPASKALVFPFQHFSGTECADYQFILERVENQNQKGRYFLRLSVESPQNSTITLSAIPHTIVNDLRERVYIAGSTKIAQSIRDGILNACFSGLKSYSEENRIYSQLFEQLGHTKLGRMERLNFVWSDDFIHLIQNEAPEVSQLFFKKFLISLEAGAVCDILKRGGTVKLKFSGLVFTLYLSQLSRVINVGINVPRITYHLNHYLNRMPELESLTNQNVDFSGINIFLIHHITSEVLAFISALKKLNVEQLNVLFVKYGGVVPSSYLDALLENTSESLFMAGLFRKRTVTNRDYYTLAEYLSDISTLSHLNQELEQRKLGFFDAMNLTAMHIFLKFCLNSMEQGKKVLLIEDGGYLAPILNRCALDGLGARAVFEKYLVDTDLEDEPFSEVLSHILIGTVEHTKNGYDRMCEVRRANAGLFFPAYSIAVSDNKAKEESQEVAHSILSAIESILHQSGLVLSRRKVIVLGAAGNIGSFLCKHLVNGRLHETNTDLLQVDSKFHTNGGLHQYADLEHIPEKDLYSRDLFIGVIGKSILQKYHLEKLLLQGDSRRIFFASGSTKTVEFSDLSDWLYELSSAKSPTIGEIPLQIEHSRINDPQSSSDLGAKVTIQFEKDGHLIKKKLYLLGDLSPVNFLYYGVPTEMMDTILSQLLKVSLGITGQYRASTLLPPNLYAVDKEIDEWGNLLDTAGMKNGFGECQ
jgi:hypothetical protein